jgi:hypothetical protein
LLLDLVAMLITDVRAKWAVGSPAGPLASGARFSSRHCKGVPATPFPPLQINDQCHHQPYQLLRSGRILAKFAKLSIVRLSIEIW